MARHQWTARQQWRDRRDEWNTLEELCRPLWELHPPPNGIDSSEEVAEDVTDSRPVASGGAADFALALSHNPNLVMFRTEEGYLGRGTVSLQEGDSIWIVPGSRVPLIMRAKPDTLAQDGMCRYELVGGAYLHGFMHGEALRGSTEVHNRKLLDFHMIEIE